MRAGKTYVMVELIDDNLNNFTIYDISYHVAPKPRSRSCISYMIYVSFNILI